jgi:hypothetical protein
VFYSKGKRHKPGQPRKINKYRKKYNERKREGIQKKKSRWDH